MTVTRDVGALASVAASFGPALAGEKLILLERIEAADIRSGRTLRVLHDVLCFLRAYSDDARVLSAVTSAASRLRQRFSEVEVALDAPAFESRGFPGSATRYAFSLPVLRRLLRRHTGCLEIDWDGFEEQDQLINVLALVVTSPECQGIDDIEIDLPSWFSAARSPRHQTDLELLVELFDRSGLDPAARDTIWESCATPIRYGLDGTGTARCELFRPVDRVCYQRRELDRKLLPIRPTIRRPLPRVRRLRPSAGEGVIELALRTLCARGLEIRTLSYANADDVTVADCGRGLQIALMGVIPSYRDPLESHDCCLILKNGVPIAYGPGTVSLGCCEIGLNLFPEFRGAEVRFIYPQLMRALHQILGAEYFFLTAYGMGMGNPEAIRTGAFWFYRRLGFLPTNPAVETLAQAEEVRMQAESGYRSSPVTLRQLSKTSVYLDLSGGACRPLDLGAIGLEHSRFVAERYDGDRPRSVRTSLSLLARLLDTNLRDLVPGERRAWEMLGPLLDMVPHLAGWSRRDLLGLRRVLKAKGSRSEARVDRMIRSHPRLVAALRALNVSVDRKESPG